MNCIVDRGNSKTKVYFFEENDLKASFSFFSTENEKINEALATFSFSKGIISSSSDIPAYFPLDKFLVLSSSINLPIELNYKTPQTLGSDRIALAVGADYIYPDKNILVISAGTCITIDLIDAKGIYQGGIITPGMTIRLQSLHTFTENLPLLEYKNLEDYPLLGKSTNESMESGIYNGALAEIEQTINRFKTNYQDLTVIITGGDLKLFELHLKNEIFAQPNLQALGLNRILLHNAL